MTLQLANGGTISCAVNGSTMHHQQQSTAAASVAGATATA
jgi:hypothetical protein